MRLTAKADYALRTLMLLAMGNDKLITIADIAHKYGISKAHLNVIVHQLGRQGIIETVRGRSGGLRLAQSPDKINMGKVIRFMEDDTTLAECFREDGCCLVTSACRIKQALHEATEAFYGILESYTLADLVDDNRKLRKLLII